MKNSNATENETQEFLRKADGSMMKNMPTDVESNFFFWAYPNPQKVGPEQTKMYIYASSAQMENAFFVYDAFTFFGLNFSPNLPTLLDISPPVTHR